VTEWRVRWSRTKAVLLGRRREDELVDEIELHLEHLTAEYVRRGLPPAEARLRARREFGGVAQTREAFRDQRRWPSIDTLFQDVRFATRALIKDRGTTVAAIALLTMGVGTTVVMADVLDRLLLRAPAHVDRPDLARRIYDQTDAFRPSMLRSNYSTLEKLAAGLPQEIEVWGAFEQDRISMGHGAEARRLEAVSSTEGYFDVLGVKAALGQLPSTKRPVVPDGAAISHGLWQRDFGGTIDVIGKPLRLGRRTYTVVAVMPRGFTGIDDDPVDLWLPLATRKDADPEWKTGTHYFGLMGLVRLRPGVARNRAETHASHVFDLVKGKNWGDANTKTAILFGDLLPARAPGGTAMVRVLLPIAAVSTLVLLIACGNVGNLLLVRGLRRAPELALKAALGATRLRLLRETVIEALLLAFGSGIAALVVVMTVGVLVRRYFLPPMAATVVPLDTRLTLVTVAVCTLAALVLSLAPALRLTRTRMATPGRVALRGGASPLLDVFVGAQVALSVPLLVGAVLFATSVWLGRQDDFGFAVPRVVAARSDLAEDGRPAEQAAAHLRLAEAMARLPGVTSVSVVGQRPFIEGTAKPFEIPGIYDSTHVRTGFVEGPYVNAVDEAFFRTIGLRVTSGRTFSAADNASSAPPVVVVNEAMQGYFWRDRSPLGSCIRVAAVECARVVGVVANGLAGPHVGADPPLMLYFLPIGRFPDFIANRAVLVRTQGDPSAMVPALQRQAATVGGHLPYVDVWPLSDVLEPHLKPLRLGSTVFLCLSGLALLIAAAGLIVVTAHGVTRRTREMGIHLSLGATPGIVVRLMLRRTLIALAIGLAAGIGLALAASPLFTDLLYRIEPGDPRVLIACALTLLAVGVLAAYVPARRAGRIDPAEALRFE
jgi:predicted permease